MPETTIVCSSRLVTRCYGLHSRTHEFTNSRKNCARICSELMPRRYSDSVV